MILIMSSAYLSIDFQVEIGAIPPAFLPIGNRKLIEHQVSSLRTAFPNQEIILSLPESFNLTETYKKQLSRLEIKVVTVPDSLSLSESVLYLLNTQENLFKVENPLSILYGDTYFSDFSFVESYDDLIAVSEAKNSYNWEYLNGKDHHQNWVWCGYFLLSNIPLFLKSLALNRDDFNTAVKYYAKYQKTEYVYTDNWLDLGHVNTYFASRASLTTQRAFNDLSIVDGVVRKSGNPQLKIEAEAYWFNSIPPSIRRFTPLYLGTDYYDDRIYYSIEYLPNMPLNELFVHGQNQLQDWSRIFLEIKNWFSHAKITLPKSKQVKIVNDYKSLVVEKTLERLQQYTKLTDISLSTPQFYAGRELPSLNDICQECCDSLAEFPSIIGILHGDLCFSNMLFDFRSLKLKVIDPRGLNANGEFTIYGDIKYDLAKLTHSVIGLYDFIISGNYIVQNENSKSVSLHFDIDQRIEEIQSRFMEIEFIPDIKISDIIPLVIILFLSMLPLHSDRPDRQKAMLLNALKMYTELNMDL